MAAYYNRICNRFEGIPTNRYAFYVDNELICVTSYFPKEDGDRHEFLKDYRLFWARCENVTWERIKIKLVDAVNGVVPTLPVADSLTVLSVIDMVNK